MSKRSKARRDELIRSMEGLAALKAPESSPATPTTPKPGKPTVKYAICLIVGIVFAAALLWLLRH